MLFCIQLMGYRFHNPFTNFLLSKSYNLPCSIVPGAFDQIGERYIYFVCKNHYTRLTKKPPPDTIHTHQHPSPPPLTPYPPAKETTTKSIRSQFVMTYFSIQSHFNYSFPLNLFRSIAYSWPRINSTILSVLALASGDFHLATSGAIWCHHMNHTCAI